MIQAKEMVALNDGVHSEKPLWLKDGSGVIFAGAPDNGAGLTIAGTTGGQQNFWVAAVDGSGCHQLTQNIGGLPFLSIRDAQRSPDGQWLAFLSNRADKSGEGLEAEIWLQPLLRPGPALQLTRLGGIINSFQWAPDSQSIALASNRYGRFDIFAASIPDGHTTRLTNHHNYEVYPAFSPDGSRLLFVRLDAGWTGHEVWATNPDGSKPTLVTTDENFFDYHFGRNFGYPLPAPDGSCVLFRSHRSGWINYWSARLDADARVEAVRPLMPAKADQSEAAWAPDGRYLAYVENHNGNLQLRILDVRSGSTSIVAGDREGACAGPTWSPDGQHLAYLFQTTTTPLDLWIVKLQQQEDGVAATEHHRLTDASGGQDLSYMVKPEKIYYPTFDGRDIPSYLYRPRTGGPGEQFPGIIWIHGGPTSQFMDTYQPQVQYFVQRGYVVLLPNIRGSSGYGREFEDLNNADWGGDDLKDVVAGAEYLKALPEVDAQNLGIHGTSYGGCMTMAAVAFAPTVFQAAVPHGGYSDWIYDHEEQELRHLQQMRYEFGPFEENRDIYHKCSPYHSIANMQTPTLVVQGTGSLPQSEASRLFFEEARRLYKPVRYKTYPSECYYVRSPKGVCQLLADMLDFFDEKLKGF